MSYPTIRRIGWRWDHANRVLWASLALSDGQTFGVGLPLSEVVAVFDAEARKLRIDAPALVGECATVSGFFSRVRKTVRRAKKKAMRRVRKLQPRVVRRLTSRVSRIHDKFKRRALKVGLKVARSKRVGMVLGASAAVCPAIGGPALGAWTAANTAARIYDRANRAKRQAMRFGRTSPQGYRSMIQGRRIQQNVRQLIGRSDPRSRMVRSALRSVHSRSW